MLENVIAIEKSASDSRGCYSYYLVRNWKENDGENKTCLVMFNHRMLYSVHSRISSKADNLKKVDNVLRRATAAI